MCSLLCLRFSSIFGYVSSEGITDACSFEEGILGLEETNSEELVVDDICAIEDVDDVEEVDFILTLTMIQIMMSSLSMIDP